MPGKQENISAVSEILRASGTHPAGSHPHHKTEKDFPEGSLFCLAEMVGFEPTCPVKDKTISSRSRYDHFDTSPYSVLQTK